MHTWASYSLIWKTTRLALGVKIQGIFMPIRSNPTSDSKFGNLLAYFWGFRLQWVVCRIQSKRPISIAIKIFFNVADVADELGFRGLNLDDLGIHSVRKGSATYSKVSQLSWKTCVNALREYKKSQNREEDIEEEVIEEGVVGELNINWINYLSWIVIIIINNILFHIKNIIFLLIFRFFYASHIYPTILCKKNFAVIFLTFCENRGTVIPQKGSGPRVFFAIVPLF